jgi:hypothetical protein
MTTVILGTLRSLPVVPGDSSQRERSGDAVDPTSKRRLDFDLCGSRTDEDGKSDMAELTYSREPVPHVVVDPVTDGDTYRSLPFPKVGEHIDDDERWGLVTGDPGYDEFVDQPGWRELRRKLTGEEFVGSVLDAFAADMRRHGCLVDPDGWYLDDFVESRQDKERPVLAEEGDPNRLFVRFDFQSKSGTNYDEFVHVDWNRRVAAGLLFFCDADEEGLVGGELALYRDRRFRNDRECHDPERVLAFTPRHNKGLLFLNSNEGFHGPARIERLTGRRRWVYVAISSHTDVWPHRGPTLASRAKQVARRAKQRVSARF